MNGVGAKGTGPRSTRRRAARHKPTPTRALADQSAVTGAQVARGDAVLPTRQDEAQHRADAECCQVTELVRPLDEAPPGGDGLVALLRDAPDCVAVLDPDGAVIWLNDAAREAWASRTVDPLGASFASVWKQPSPGHVDDALRRARVGRPTRFRGIARCEADASTIWEVQLSSAADQAGPRPTLLVVARDVTKQVERQALLQRATDHDSMTGLLNRSAFIRRVSLAMLKRERVTLVLLDVDHLKRANDTDGHAAGDHLIRHWAARLREIGDGRGVAARLGGDEFALACFGDVDEGELRETVARLCRPARVGRLTMPCSASAGIAFGPAFGSFDEMYVCADAALYVAKAADGGQARLFDADMRATLQRKSCVVSLTKRAVACGDIVPFYQPKVDLASGDVIGFEALLRVRFPDGSVQTATAVAAALREPDLAAAIDRAMLARVLADLRLWREHRVARPVAVNLSNGLVREKGFAARFLGEIASADVEPRLIEVEITESVLLDAADSPMEGSLLTLSAAGVRIALDDFGTGYASLSHLKRFPIDAIKIDRQFIQSLPADTGDLGIVRAMIGLGRSLELEVVAEGVECLDQLGMLRREGCTTGQGFFFSPAVPERDARGWADGLGPRARECRRAWQPTG